jgi:hypothetical protein
VIDSAHRDPLEADLLLVISTPWWELGEPASYAPHVLADPFSDTPPKRIL